MFVPVKTRSDTGYERWPIGEVLFRGFRLLGDSLVSKGRAAERVKDSCESRE